MFAYQFSPDLEQELSEIPAEYQEAFRHALEQELQEGEHDRTDTDRLHYLRQRRSAFQQGSYIRPDGRPGMVQLSADALYEQGFADLLHPSDAGANEQSERRQTIFKVAGLLLAVCLFLFWAVRARAQRAEARTIPPTETVAVVSAAIPTPQPTAALPEITGADETLKTVGGLGGTLTLGRPSSLELHYASTEETIALPIDPSRPTNKGELRYDEARMLSDNPVAVWLFGTVMNYAIGIPEAMVRNLQPGDRLTVNTDTGAILHFIVSEQWVGANHETGRWLSQNRTGVTLFALPASAETEVAFVFASYDLLSEAAASAPLHTVGEVVALDQNDTFQIETIVYEHTESGALQIELSGKAALGSSKQQAAQPLWLALSATWGQSDAIALTPETDGSWTATFTLPDAALGVPLFAELRALPSHVVTVALDAVPELADQLEISVSAAQWQPKQQTASITVTIHNPSLSKIYLSSDSVSLSHPQGGDALDLTLQPINGLQPLPVLLLAGETLTETVTFLTTQSPIHLQIGTDRWEISGIPIASE